ncbi:hemerythrin HHE cation binding domain-containing protein [Halopolyspora algeriensis]|uniref:Hemerythrin HHE cation binding domain-containing protein n=1 Tax=Halopolyspora algeriensis TaxID=1500506 RepID=A0A368W0X3_9ACTN|nr:hemerythrin domain-containing protein [Halopolyspora algeriensis]RCW46241.1 hemerythrin HHE cation binding domain-containing protein [Halopolyspora algeriensis]TQM55644.1 hemerythrin HHE cation binding domain-containing protein [Halopolyspora algeriensis]
MATPEGPSTQRQSLVDVIIADHRAVDEVFGQLETGSGSDEHRRQLVEHVITELVRHSVAEEQYLYPAAREKLSDGDHVADREVEEHAEAEQLMKQLEATEEDDPEFDRMTGKLITDIRHHIEEEERDLLPRLSEACTADELDDLGKKVMMAKSSAPTRPHPTAPDTPPANMILDPGAGMIDRLRDALSGRNR